MTTSAVEVLPQGMFISFALGWVVDKLRHSNYKWFNWITPASSANFIKCVRVAAAVLSTVGIVFAWDPAGVVTISGLTQENLMLIAQIIGQNFIMQSISDVGFKVNRATGEAPLISGTTTEARKTGAEVIMVDTKGKVEKAQDKE